MANLQYQPVHTGDLNPIGAWRNFMDGLNNSAAAAGNTRERQQKNEAAIMKGFNDIIENATKIRGQDQGDAKMAMGAAAGGGGGGNGKEETAPVDYAEMMQYAEWGAENNIDQTQLISDPDMQASLGLTNKGELDKFISYYKEAVSNKQSKWSAAETEFDTDYQSNVAKLTQDMQSGKIDKDYYDQQISELDVKLASQKSAIAKERTDYTQRGNVLYKSSVRDRYVNRNNPNYVPELAGVRPDQAPLRIESNARAGMQQTQQGMQQTQQQPPSQGQQQTSVSSSGSNNLKGYAGSYDDISMEDRVNRPASEFNDFISTINEDTGERIVTSGGKSEVMAEDLSESLKGISKRTGLSESLLTAYSSNLDGAPKVSKKLYDEYISNIPEDQWPEYGISGLGYETDKHNPYIQSDILNDVSERLSKGGVRPIARDQNLALQMGINESLPIRKALADFNIDRSKSLAELNLPVPNIAGITENSSLEQLADATARQVNDEDAYVDVLNYKAQRTNNAIHVMNNPNASGEAFLKAAKGTGVPIATIGSDGNYTESTVSGISPVELYNRSNVVRLPGGNSTIEDLDFSLYQISVDGNAYERTGNIDHIKDQVSYLKNVASRHVDNDAPTPKSFDNVGYEGLLALLPEKHALKKQAGSEYVGDVFAQIGERVGQRTYTEDQWRQLLAAGLKGNKFTPDKFDIELSKINKYNEGEMLEKRIRSIQSKDVIRSASTIESLLGDAEKVIKAYDTSLNAGGEPAVGYLRSKQKELNDINRKLSEESRKFPLMLGSMMMQNEASDRKRQEDRARGIKQSAENTKSWGRLIDKLTDNDYIRITSDPNRPTLKEEKLMKLRAKEESRRADPSTSFIQFIEDMKKE